MSQAESHDDLGMSTSFRAKAGRLLANLAKSLGSGVPTLGPIYDQLLAQYGQQDLDALLIELSRQNREQLSELATQVQLTKEQLSKLPELIAIVGGWVDERSNGHERITVVIPTGGSGLSMAPITYLMPKCLATVGRKPLLHHILNSFLDSSHRPLPIIRKVIVHTRSFHDAIAESVERGGYGAFVQCRQINEGVPAALLRMKNDDLASGPFLVHYNDILIEKINWVNVYRSYREHRQEHNVVGMLVCSRYYPLGIGVIREVGTDPHMLKSFEEKPEHLMDGLANLGVAIFDHEVLNYLKKEDRGIFEDTMKSVLDAKRSVALFEVGKWEHIHEFRDLHRAQKDRGALPDAQSL